MDTPPEPSLPDTKDWTTVLESGCDECGYRPHDPATTSNRLASARDRWLAVLRRPGVERRPHPRRRSPLEYAGHCRDLIEVLGDRIAAMLDRAEPTYDDFDGEAAVVEHGYWRSDPDDLARRLDATTARTLKVLDRVGPADRDRTGRRGDGYVFTIASLCQYIVHDVEHHLGDVDG